MGSITNLATTTALTAVENKIPSVSNLVKKNDYNAKTNKIEKKTADHNHDKYTATIECNKLTLENFVARLKQANLTSKHTVYCKSSYHPYMEKRRMHTVVYIY